MANLSGIIASYTDTSKGLVYTINQQANYKITNISSNYDLKDEILKLPQALPLSSKLIAMSKNDILYAYEHSIIRYNISSKKHKQLSLKTIGTFSDITSIRLNQKGDILLVGDITGHVVMLDFKESNIKLISKLKDEISNITVNNSKFIVMTFASSQSKPQLLIYDFIKSKVILSIDLDNITLPTSAIATDKNIFILDSNHDELEYTSKTLDIKTHAIISSYTKPGYNRNVKNVKLFLDNYALISGLGKVIYLVNISTNELILEYVLQYDNIIDITITHRHIFIVLSNGIQVIPIFKYEENYFVIYNRE